MADSTFLQLWRRLKAHAPDLPVPLAQEFVNTAYSRALGSYRWSQLRGAGTLYVPAPYETGTVSLTNGSATVTGSGTAWTASLEGRQLILGGIAPFRDIADVSSATSLTLSQAYQGPDLTSQTYSIQLCYPTLPTDFEMFISVVDLVRNWKLWDAFLPEFVDRWDAQRSYTGTPWIVLPAAPNTAGVRRCEVWPRPGVEATFQFTYLKKPALMSADADAPIYPLRGDVIREGALAELALWPGLANQPNLYFSPETHRLHEQRFWKGVGLCQVEDQEIFPTNFYYPEWDSWPHVPLDAKFLQQHGGFF